MTEVVRGAYRKPSCGQKAVKVKLWSTQIDPPAELFPVAVDVCVDKRASTRRIGELVHEIIGSNPNANVICNGVEGDRVLTFQKAKGANNLADKDIYIIVTHLNPDHYAQLNVIGQWLGIPDVIQLYYRNQISQAVGRNKGFRATAAEGKTVVIASSRLRKSSIFVASKPPLPTPSSNNQPQGASIGGKFLA